jgi:hypothetical protein
MAMTNRIHVSASGNSGKESCVGLLPTAKNLESVDAFFAVVSAGMMDEWLFEIV